MDLQPHKHHQMFQMYSLDIHRQHTIIIIIIMAFSSVSLIPISVHFY